MTASSSKLCFKQLLTLCTVVCFMLSEAIAAFQRLSFSTQYSGFIRRLSAGNRPIGPIKAITALWISLLLSPACFAADAYIKLESDTRDVSVGNAIVLDIEYSGLIDTPDFDQLKSIAQFDRETYGTRIAVISGKVVEIHIRRMEFIATDATTLLFGPVEAEINEAEKIVSNSVAVRVTPASDSKWQLTDTDATLSVTVSPENPTLYQMMTLEVVLRHSYQIADESIQLPVTNKVQTRTLYSERRTIADDGTREVAWKYLLFPTASGSQILSALEWSGTMIKSRNERAKFNRSSEAINIHVAAAGGDASSGDDDWWLPAASLDLTEIWSKDVRELRAGDEVTREITLSADGVTAGQLPEPDVLESRAITQTLINTKRKEQLLANTIRSSATFTYRVRAQSPIPVFLDTVRVPWWNTRSRESKEAIIPARRINIGLPERADLLAQLALEQRQENFLQRFFSPQFLNTLTGARFWQPLLWLVIALLLSAIAALLYLRQRSSSHLHSSNKIPAARKFLLRQLAEEEQWDSFYVALLEQCQVDSANNERNTLSSKQPVTTQTDPDLHGLLDLAGKLAFSAEKPERVQIRQLQNRLAAAL